MNMSKKSRLFILILNSLLLTVFILTGWGFNDVTQYAAEGGDPLGLMFIWIISIPALLVLGIILIILKQRLQLPTINLLIPFVGILAMILPLMLSGSTPGGQNEIVEDYWKRIGWITIGALAFLSTVTLVVTLIIWVSKANRSQFSI